MGERLTDRYEIIKLFGRGGTAYVYLAKDHSETTPFQKDNPICSVKTLIDGGYDRKGLRRFLREAQALATVSHPHIIPIYDVAEDKDRPFLVTEFYKGGTLKSLIDKSKLESPDDIKLMLHYGADICDALQCAHDAGIYHRDLKPENVYVSEEITNDSSPRPVLKLADFGIAHLRDASSALTTANRILGTIKYASPEQLMALKKKDGSADIDGRTDLYSFGVMLYHMLTKKYPYEGDERSVMYQHVDKKVSPIPPSALNKLIPPVLDAIVFKLLRKNRDERYDTAKEVSTRLRQIASLDKFESLSGILYPN